MTTLILFYANFEMTKERLVFKYYYLILET